MGGGWLASYLGLFFCWGGKKRQGEGILTRKRDGGRLERKKRVKGKERGRGNRCTSSERVA